MQGGDHSVARAVGLHGAIAQQQDAVCHGNGAGAVGDQKHGLALGLELFHGFVKRGLAHVVQVGVGLIEHHDHGVAINRAGQANALALAARKQIAGLADRGVVAFGEAQDHFMQAGAFGGFNHFGGVGLAEAGNVFGDAAFKQLDVLWQVADVGPKLDAVPALDRQAVEQHLARHVGPDADHHPCQR